MFDLEGYQLASQLFFRLLGLVYFFAHSPYLFQIRGLLGKQGISPAENYLHLAKNHYGKKAYYLLPGVFWGRADDVALLGVMGTTTVLSLLLAMGFSPQIILPLLYLGQLSLLSVGQDFLSFGWDVFILEMTCNAWFLSLTSPPNPLIWVSINLLLFRFYFQAGAVKLQSRDKNWRNLTALHYHYQTQPLPNTIAWYVYKLPLWFHKASTLLMFIIELVVPFAIFGTPEMRLVVFVCFFLLQFIIWFTGNFSYLNHMSVAFSVILLHDSYLKGWLPISVSSPTSSLALEIFVSLAGIALILLQVVNLYNHFFPNRTFYKILRGVQPFHIANRYGIFAIMTTKRYEIVIEGSNDGMMWQEYLFKHKPSEITRRPRRISPFQPRLDWQAWFLPFSSYETNIWFQMFLRRLLEGSPRVLALLRYNPFPDQPPRYIRAVAYDYVFSDWKTKKETGRWWQRTFVGNYSPTLGRQIAD